MKFFRNKKTRRKRGRRLTYKRQRGGSHTVDLVIARYKEDLDWLKKYEHKLFHNLYIYNKGPTDVSCKSVYNGKSCSVIKLPNVGVCDQTYLQHIINNYDKQNFAEVTVFAPGSVFNKKTPLKKTKFDTVLKVVEETHGTVFLCEKLSKPVDEEFNDFHLTHWAMSNNSNKNTIGAEKHEPASLGAFGEWYRANFPGEKVTYMSYWGIFAVSKEDILSRPKSFYENLNKQMNTHKFHSASHMMERAWASIPKDKGGIYDLYGNRMFDGGGVTGPSAGQPNIPIFIISYNQYTYVKSMVEQLMKFPNMNIYIIDNKSTYPPLLEYLKSIEGKVKVLYQPENYGHTVYERDEIIALGGDKYVVTDPDLILNPKLPKNFLEIMAELSDKYRTNKIGFALDITNNINLKRRVKITEKNAQLETAHEWKQFENISIPEWERKHWQNRIADSEYELYRVPIDTTFALINKKYYIKGSMANSIRIAGDFTAVHRTWLNDFEKELKPGEHEFYMGQGNKSSTIGIWKNMTKEQKGGTMKRVFLSKSSDYVFFEEYLKSICNGDEIRLWSTEATLPGDTFYMCVREVPYDKIPSSCKIGFINTEQLSDPAKFKEYNSMIRDGVEVYDYSRDNIKISGRGTYLPYREVKEEVDKLKKFMDVKKEYDVAIVIDATSSKRRFDAIDAIVASGIKVHKVSGWGEQRDREIGKARILLNIHYSDTYNIYEALRCERWRFAGMPIISEPSASQMPEGLIEARLNEFPQKIKELLNRE